MLYSGTVGPSFDLTRLCMHSALKFNVHAYTNAHMLAYTRSGKRDSSCFLHKSLKSLECHIR